MATFRIHGRACETDAYPVGVLGRHLFDAHDATPANTKFFECGPKLKSRVFPKSVFSLKLQDLPDSQTNGPPESPLHPEVLP